MSGGKKGSSLTCTVTSYCGEDCGGEEEGGTKGTWREEIGSVGAEYKLLFPPKDMKKSLHSSVEE